MLEAPLQIVAAEGIDCGWKRVDGYLFPGTPSQETFEILDQEMAAYVRAGQTDVRKVLPPPPGGSHQMPSPGACVHHIG